MIFEFFILFIRGLGNSADYYSISREKQEYFMKKKKNYENRGTALQSFFLKD